MTKSSGQDTVERRMLRRLARHTGTPTLVRNVLDRIERSDLAYRLAYGMFWSIMGTVLTRALALTVSVFTARILGKEIYGEFGIITSTLLTLQVVSSLGLGMTITKHVAELRNSDPERVGRILGLAVVLGAMTGLLATVVLWCLAPWLAREMLNAPHLAGLLRIVALGLVFTTINGVQSGAISGFEAFRTSAKINLWSGLLGVPITVGGVYYWGLVGAVWATVVSAALQWALTQVAVRAQADSYGIRIRLSGWWCERRLIWTYSLPALAVDTMVAPVNWAAAAILVNQPGGFAELGVYSAANQWYGAILFLPAALGRAVFPVLSERIGQDDVAGARKVLRAAMILNATVVIPVVVAGSVASPIIMGMYGANFADAWPTLLVVLCTAGIFAVMYPVGNVIAASGRLWLGFFMNTAWAAVFLGSTLSLVNLGSLGLASGRLIAYAAHAVWTFWFAAIYIGRKKRY